MSDLTGSSITANGSDSSQRIHVPLLKGESQQFLNGQEVWVNPVERKVMLVKFPVQSEHKDNIGNAHWMDTSVTVSNPASQDTGRIDGSTHTWSKEALRGFEGGVMVFLLDDQKNVLYSTPLHKYGVNGEAMGNNDRHDTWKETGISKDIIDNTRSVAIVHLDAPTSHWNDFVAKAKDVL